MLWAARLIAGQAVAVDRRDSKCRRWIDCIASLRAASQLSLPSGPEVVARLESVR